MSKFFGSPEDPKVQDHIIKGIYDALKDSSQMFPFFISPVNGATFPLSPYYQKRFLDSDSAYQFALRRPSFLDQLQLSFQQIEDKENKFNSVKQFLDSKHTYVDDEMNSFNLNFIDCGILETTSLSDQDFADSWSDF